MLTWITSAHASWSEATRVGDDVYVFQRDPARMERYDLVNEEWKETIMLPVKTEALTAAHADEDGVYLGYGSAVYRYDLEAENEVFVVSQTSPVVRILSRDSFVIVLSRVASNFITNSTATTFLKANNSLIATQILSNGALRNPDWVTINPTTGNLHSSFGSTTQFSIAVADDGTLERDLSLSILNPRGSQSVFESGRLYFYPTEDRFVGSQGRVFSNTRLRSYTLQVETGLVVKDLVFKGADVPLVLQDNQVTALRNNFQPAGSKPVSFQAERLFLIDEDVVVFGADDEGVVLAEKIALSELGDPTPGEPIDQVGVAYEPDYTFVDTAGVVNVYSEQFSTLFRWDPRSQQPLPSINLNGLPVSYYYTPTLNRFYFGFAEGRVDFVSFAESNPTQRNLISDLESLEVIADAGANILVQRSFGSSSLYRSNGTVLSNGSTVLQASGSVPFRAVWDPTTSRLYVVRFGSLSMIPLMGGTFGGTVSSSSGFGGPLVIAPGRVGVITSTGAVADLADLSPEAVSLGNAVLDATTQGASAITIREIAGLSQVQTWEGANLAPGVVKQLPGTPISIDRVNSSWLVALTLGANGIPSFYLLDSDLVVVPPLSLDRPLGLVGGVTGLQNVRLNWLDISGEEEYSIERRVSGTGDYEEVGTVTTSVTTFDDVVPAGVGTNYEYRVIAVNGDLRSEPTEAQEVRFELPEEVMGFTVTTATENSITVSWDPLANVVGYELEWIRLRNNSRVQANPQPDAGTTSFTFTNLAPVEEYTFRLRGANGLGNGPWISLNATTLPPLPFTPQNFQVSGTPTSFGVRFFWSQSLGGTDYVLERRKLGSSEFVEIFRGEQSSFQDSGLEPSTPYEYRIRAENVRGLSDYTEILEVTTGELLPPGQPSSFTGMNVVGGIRLIWSFPTIDFTFGGGSPFDTTAESVLIERRADEGEPFVLLADVPLAEALEFLDETVVPEFRYSYRARAKNAAGISSFFPQTTLLAIDGVCLLSEDFEGPLDSPNLTIRGGEVRTGATEGFDGRGALYFGGSLERSFVTAPLDLRYGGTLDYSGRTGDATEPGSLYWDAPEAGEIPRIEYLNLDDTASGWRLVSTIFGINQSSPELVSSWSPHLVRLPSVASERGVVIRITQSGFDGPGLDTWALDRICILGHKTPNNPPVLDPTMPVTLTANATGDPIRLNFSQWISENDSLDRVYYEIGAVSNPAIFSAFTVDLESGLLNLEFAPQATGSSTLEVVTNDSAGGSASHTFTVNAPTLQAPTIVREGLVELNPITGKYEQTLTIANNGPRGIAGIQVVVTSLNNGFVLDGHENNIAVSNAPLEPGGTVSLVLEYHSAVSGVAPRPDFEIQILSPEGEAQEPGGGAAALRTMSDSGQLFSFDAVVGQTYEIEYSYDMITWQTSPVTVTAGANRAQWLDQGPPKTDCHPSECPSRFYRVVPVIAE